MLRWDFVRGNTCVAGSERDREKLGGPEMAKLV